MEDALFIYLLVTSVSSCVRKGDATNTTANASLETGASTGAVSGTNSAAENTAN